MNNLVEAIIIHYQHGHLPILISGLMRFTSLLPLTIVFISVTRTFLDKLHTINGLRPYRVAMMAILLAAMVDQSIFFYFNVVSFFSTSNNFIPGQNFLVFNSFVTLMAYGFLYFLFLHASKKDELH